MVENLLNMYVYLPEYSRGYGASVGFVTEKGHAVLNTGRLENRFGDPEGKTVEWSDDDDTVIALVFGIQALPHGWDCLAEDLR